MSKIAVILSNGFEEIEGLTPIDVLRRAGLDVDGVSIHDKVVKGSRKISVVADYLLSEVDASNYDCYVLPGGMPGATHLSQCKELIDVLKNAIEKNKLICAICASPAVVLGQNGLYADGVKATCYPAEDFIKVLGERYEQKSVVVSKNFITADGIKSAMEFAITIAEKLGATPKF